MKRCLCIIWLLLAGRVLQAQPYYFRNYQVGDGISSNTITCIAQDAKGFMWFGTRNGLNRFDGASFRQFRNDPHDPGSIGSNSILCLTEDEQQHLWVGTHEGIYLYDPIHEKFSRFGGIPQAEARFVAGDDHGNIWMVSDNTLYKFNPADGALHAYDQPGSHTVALGVGDNGAIWCATLSGVAKRYDPATDRFTGYDIAALLKGPVFIQTLYPVTDTTVLIATLQQVLLFNTNTGRCRNVFEGHAWANHIQVHKIIRQSPGQFWFGTENGLYILDLSAGDAQLIQKQYANPYSINDNVITDFCKDKEGNTWVGTFFGGVNYYSGRLNQFRKYFPLPGTGSLGGNLVHEICADKYDNIWVGTEDGGLNKLDRRTEKITHFMPGKSKGDISYQNIHGLLADGDTLWIGTYEHGIDLMDLRTEKVIKHFEKDGRPGSLGGNFIVTIYKTPKGEILVGTWDGLYKYQPEKKTFGVLPYFHRQAQSIHEDAEGTLWVGSYGNGVWFNNAVTGRKGSFQYDPKDTGSLSDNYVNNLYEDSRHNIWICTESGLCRYDHASHTIVRCTQEPALRGNQVFKVLEDKEGTIWISTSKGLVSLDLNKRTSKTYTTDHGLLSDQFNYNSAFRDRDGKLFFGTVKGMISFIPSAIVPNTFVPPVDITSLQVNNGDLKIGAYGSRLPQALPYTSSITLPYDSSTISLQVAALSYTMPAINEYLYKMEGLDKDWVHLNNNRKIYYTKLPPGDYVFKVKGSSAGEVWNDKETTLAIHVLPPLWARPWAYALYILTALAIGFVILRYYYIALREKNQRKIKTLEIEKEREIYNAKIEFFTNITHEIRTPLTLIKLPVEKLLRQPYTDSTLTGHLAMIDKNTNRLIQLTDQLLDFRKAEANNYTLNFVRTDINELLRETFATYKPFAEEKKLAFKLEMPRVTLLAYVDPEALRKILGNLLNNAVKYAGGIISIRLLPFNSDDDRFQIECRNDGLLIPADMKERIFEPFFRLKGTEKYAGTGIGLPLSRSLAELHQGTLSLKEPADGLNTFCLSIPIHQLNEIDLVEYDPAETAAPVTEGTQGFPYHPSHPVVLIVEDNKEIAGFLEKELHHKFNVHRSANGRDALEVLAKENVQLVISDIMMPVMDGIELCRRIKTDIQYSHIPIILLTAKNTIRSRIEGLETGADAYIEKPFLFEHLLAQMNNLLHNRNIVKEYYAHSPLAHIKGIASTRADTTFLEDLQGVIDANITNIDLDVDTLAKMMNMSRGTFYRKIKGLSDLTPNELITLSRLKKAAELLAEGKYKITEVAHMVGYHLNSNFSRDFSRQFGMSPSVYVKSLGEQQEHKEKNKP